jgi:hypothetical protein
MYTKKKNLEYVIFPQVTDCAALKKAYEILPESLREKRYELFEMEFIEASGEIHN